jgi:hypothetical protein
MVDISDRWRLLDSQRHEKLERARYCSSLTIPSVMPPIDWTEQQELPQPYSSTAARGVTAMASRMLSALLPLNDMPFFKFELDSGDVTDPDIETYLNTLSYQVFNKLSGGNIRETIYQALQSLIICGDVMIVMDDSMNFRIIRLDRYTVRRDVYGAIEELIYIEYENEKSMDTDPNLLQTSTMTAEYRSGYKTLYNHVIKKDDSWKFEQQDAEGNVLDSGEWEIPPFTLLRWAAIPGENYGRSHCEDLIGDIKTLEAFTEGLIQGVTAASAFWIGVDPTGMTEVDDIANSGVGSFVSARANDIHTISPANTISSQLSATQQGVEILRREVGRAFLLDSASIPNKDRVTATAVRMIGQELEHVLGGAFSSIARELMRPIVQRTIFLMTSEGSVDSRLKEMFTKQEGGLLSVEIVTGLQALSRDSDLSKLMQMGEMVRNLPEMAAQTFRWDAYGKALISSLGFNADHWVKSEADVRQEQMDMAQAQAQMQGQQQITSQIGQGIASGVGAAAQQDIAETGGQGIEQALQQIGGI